MTIRSASLWLAFCTLLSFPCGLLHAQAANSVAEAPAAAQKPLKDALQYEQRQQLSAAVDSLHTAIKASGGHCAPCLDVLARVQMKMELFRDSAATATQLAKEAADPAGQAQADYRQGLALFALYFAQNEGRGGIDKDPKKAAAALKDAEAALAQGESVDPANEPLRMLHGRVLAAMKHDEDASREFNACAASNASPAECARAVRFEKDVALARNEPAPAFSLKDIDGKTVSLDSLSGKVVLIDFWATWCKFCERDSDYVQSMLGSFDKSRFALLEISVDEDEKLWKNYVDSNRLEGLQTLDASGEVSGLFHVSGYPTYLILDGDGSIRTRFVGARGDLRGSIRKLMDEQAAKPQPDRQALPKAGGR